MAMLSGCKRAVLLQVPQLLQSQLVVAAFEADGTPVDATGGFWCMHELRVFCMTGIQTSDNIDIYR